MIAKSKSFFTPSSVKVVGVVLFVLSLLIWLWGGARAGWTLNEVVVWEVDEITGLDYPVKHEALVPGIEFPAVGFAFLFACSVLEQLLRRISSHTKN